MKIFSKKGTVLRGMRIVIAIFVAIFLTFGIASGGAWAAPVPDVEPGPTPTPTPEPDTTPPDSGSGNSCAGVNTSLINCDVGEDDKSGNGIFYLLSIVLNILTFGVGAAGVLGLVISGIQYMTANGNPAQMTKAKNRIIQVVIGLVAYGLFWALLEWLIPGGVL